MIRFSPGFLGFLILPQREISQRGQPVPVHPGHHPHERRSPGIAPLVRDGFAVTNAANSLGFGWLFAYTIMSGSPVAAAALTFFDAGAVDKLGAFAMITGSRLGASFIVLFIGFVLLERPGITPRPKVRHGLVVDEILAEARSGDYDLVVIGAHAGKGWRRILLDDLAHQIIVRVDRPILVMR